ncbi:hypothetical protein ACLB2K_003726 [Fragaria x ananassa]
MPSLPDPADSLTSAQKKTRHKPHFPAQLKHPQAVIMEQPDVERTSALRLKVRTSSVLRRLTPATASLLPERQHGLPRRLLFFQD